MKISVCIESVFQGMDSLAALEQVRAAGFGAFEFWNWQNKDMEKLAQKKAALGLHCVCFCTKSFELTDPDKRDTFLEGLKESVLQAKQLIVPFLITQSGMDTGAERKLQRRNICESLKAAAPLLEASGVTLLLEPLNGKIDHAGIYLESSDEGFEILETVGSPHIKLLFDVYHQQITEGDVIRRMISHIDQIGHVHCAGNPGRHELDSGELNYKGIFRALDKAGYQGYAGIEYFPAFPAAEGLAYIREITA